jgi:hypothetical protein
MCYQIPVQEDCEPMPIPEHLRMREDDDIEPVEPQAGHDMIEFLDERRDRQAQMRRQRALAIATGALSVVAAVLAVSNLILLRQVSSPQPVRVVAARAAPPPARGMVPPGPATRAARAVPETPPAREPQTAESSTSTSNATEADDTTRTTLDLPPDTTRRPASASAPRSSAPRAAAEARRSAEPPAAAMTARPAPALVDQSAPSSEADDPDPARRTARWLVQTYGRLDAESRAASVADFYSGEERAFWRRVLAAVRSQP